MKTIVFFVFFLLSIGLHSQINTITTAVPFLMITPDARASGMGETGVATSPDGNSIHWNAAKLAFADKKFGLGISYSPWLRGLVPDVNLAYVSFYSKLDSVSTIGFSMRYFSMGNIIVTNNLGNVIGQYRPNEYAVDCCYSKKISNYFSFGMAGRLICSNLVNGISVSGQDTKVGTSFAVDLGAYYHDDKIKIKGKESTLMFGMAITNIGSKIAYLDSAQKSFIPINLRLGQGVIAHLDSKNDLALQCEFNKLLVPSPPQYELDSATGFPVVNPNTGQYIILAGKNPNVSVPIGMFQSFYDAPGGFKEEMAEINFGVGMEYGFNKTFFARTGYFYEAPTKGNRQYVAVGAGIKFQFVGLDLAYLIPTNAQRNPLEKTLRFSILLEFDKIKKKN